MNRFAFGLLASTSLSCVTGPAFADVVYESISGFGASSSAPTIIEPGDTVYVGDLDQTTPAWFEVAAQSSPQTVQIQFTAARQSYHEGGSAAEYDSLNGGSSLPILLGTPGIVTGSASGPTVTAQAGTYEGSSYGAGGTPTLTLMVPGTPGPQGEGSSAPLTFATITPPAFTNYVGEGATDASSYIVDLTLPAGEALPFSFSYDFDYTLEVTDTVPEPATAALLGVGLAGIAAARRRRRRVL